MKVLIIPDIHLHHKMFDRADEILKFGQADRAVQLGDLVDDWGQQFNLPLYTKTLKRATQFHKDHPDTLWCMGNHDLTYFYPNSGMRESGHSKFAEGEVSVWLREMERAGAKSQIMHIVDNVIFTHAGLTEDWMKRRFERVGYKNFLPPERGLLHIVNHASLRELWQEDSPIWARPQIDNYKMWGDKFQVVGHTPTSTITESNNVLSTDAFSTRQDGSPIGVERFVIVDTESTDWRLAEEEK